MASVADAKSASNRVQVEVDAGRIVRLVECELCKATGNIVAHHYRGYEFPLDVWWICRSCNLALAYRHDGSLDKDQARHFVRWGGSNISVEDSEKVDEILREINSGDDSVASILSELSEMAAGK